MLEAHKDILEKVYSDERKTRVRAVMALTSPAETVTGITSLAENPLSLKNQLSTFSVAEVRKFATCESDRWLLDGSFAIPPDNPEDQGDGVGYISNKRCTASGSFSTTYPWVELAFSGVPVLQSITILFSERECNGYGVNFTVTVYSASRVALYTKAITGNTETWFVLDDIGVENAASVRISVSKWSMNYRLCRIRKVFLGHVERWTDTMLSTVDLQQEVTVSDLALPHSTLDLLVDNFDGRFNPLTQRSLFKSLEERQACLFHFGFDTGDVDDPTYWVPAGVWYLQQGSWKTTSSRAAFSFVDIIGAMKNAPFSGFTLPTTVEGWISVLLQESNFAGKYIVPAELANLPLEILQWRRASGMSCGDLLRYVCMAVNAIPVQDMQTGYLRIKQLGFRPVSRITADNLVKWPEYSDNEDVGSMTMKFDERKEIVDRYPDKDGNIITETETISDIVLDGTDKKNTKNVSVNNPFVHDENDARKVLPCARREYGGYAITTISRGNPFIEMGDPVLLENPYQGLVSARLYRRNMAIKDGVLHNSESSFLQADDDKRGSAPIVLTGSGTWKATKDGQVLVSVVGGGTGGAGGDYGNTQVVGAEVKRSDKPKDGAGGYVYTVLMNVLSGANYAYYCGAGGTGGAGGTAASPKGAAGNAGKESKFYTHPSTDGYANPDGYAYIPSGLVYGAAGNAAPLALTGAGGKAGRNGVDGLIIGGQEIKTATAGTAGENGEAGCILIEWLT